MRSLILVFAIASSPVFAERSLTGDDLRNGCFPDVVAVCDFYFHGFYAGVTWELRREQPRVASLGLAIQRELFGQDSGFCPTNGITDKEAVDTLKSFFLANRENWHEPMDKITLSALKTVFPCN